MKALLLLGVIVIGFVLYLLVRESIFEIPIKSPERFDIPAPGPIEIRRVPSYPPRTTSPSGPQPPQQQSNTTTVYGEPQAKDPYHETQENSDIPERMRNPENSFRPAPAQDHHNVAVESGIASGRVQSTSDNSQTFRQEFIEGGGEFMPGIFANDTFTDTSFSAF